jgi:hypothetical protein
MRISTGHGALPPEICHSFQKKADNPSNNLNTNLKRKVINLIPDQAFELAWMWCSHQLQQMGIPTLTDHLPAFGVDPGRISAFKGFISFRIRKNRNKSCFW